MTTMEGTKSYVVVSDELHHDKFSVTTFNRAILKAASSEGWDIRQLHMFTDGAGSQFKNRFVLSQVVKPSLLHESLIGLDWSFFATAHGKGPVDGVGGTVKRAVWRRILQERIHINSAEDFSKSAQDACPNITILLVKSQDVEVVRAELQSLWEKNDPKRIPSTHELHYVKANGISCVDVSVISPFLSVQVAQHFPERSVNFKTVEILKQPIVHLDLPIVPEVEKYYAVDYVTRFYIGRVLKASDRPKFWHMKFLHQLKKNSEIFKWPRAVDCAEVHESVIFFGPILLEGVHGLKVQNIDEINAAFANILQ